MSASPVTLAIAGPERAAALAKLTFPRYRALLQSGDPGVIRLVAMIDGEVRGLALARRDKRGHGELLSLFVARSFRRRGIGSALLQALAEQANDAGHEILTTVWMSGLPGTEAFSALLAACGWSPPSPRMVLYTAEFSRLASASWMHAFADLPAGTVLQPWSGLTPTQLGLLRQDIRFENWVPLELSPFSFAGKGIDGAPAEPRLSLAITAWDEVIGWNFAHRRDAETVRMSCTFIRPDFQPQLLMLALWREMFQRNGDCGYRRVSWAVSVEREAMVRFNDQAMRPYLSERNETWGSRLVLMDRLPQN